MDYSAHLRNTRRQEQADKIKVGQMGEDLATKFLKRLGYEIRDRNIRLGKDEIDILAYDPEDKVLVFVEVKTRKRSDVDYGPELDFHHRKKKRLKRAMDKWVAENNFDESYRLDLLCVVAGKVTQHFKEVLLDE
jgi:putative endonuclease